MISREDYKMIRYLRFASPTRFVRGTVLCRIAAAFVTVAALLTIGGAGYAQAAGEDSIVAKVDGLPIDKQDYELARRAFASDLQGMNEKARHDFLVQFLIDLKLMANEARNRKIAVDEDGLKRNVEFLREKALMEKLLGSTSAAAITDESVRLAYDRALKDIATEPETRFRTMRFTIDNDKDPKTVEAAKARAEQAIVQVNKGEDFVKVSQEMTGTSTPASLIEAGYLTRQQLRREIAEVVSDTNVGHISGPIRTIFGWEVVKVEDRRMRKPQEFEKVRDRLAAVVAREAQMKMIDQLRSAAKIERTTIADPPADQSAKSPD
jgi:peptidylprolyl isomerase/peptidyl-prolyl cis-trans isomerase C